MLVYKNYSYLVQKALLLFAIILCATACKQKNDNNKTTKKAYEVRPFNLPPPQEVDATERARIIASCQNFMDTVLALKGFNGGILIAKNNSIIFEKYSGSVNLDGVTPVTDTTPMHIASVSKTFTAMAILKLWQDAKLNIDEEIFKYLPNFNYPGVTIRSLLNHRSSLPNYTHYMEQLVVDKTKAITNADVLQSLIANKNTLPQGPPPNTHFSYCNTNYALLALIIEKVSGTTYPEYLNEQIFKPLGLKHTFVFNIKDTAKVAPSFDWKGRKIPFNFLDAVYGDKNIYTTPKDLLLWDRLLRSNALFTTQILEQAYKPYSNEKPGIKNYGLGWRMNIYPDGKKVIFHNGWWHGSNAVFIRLLPENATIICIGNKFNRSIYGAKILTNLFGNFYDDEPEENEQNTISQLDTAAQNKLLPAQNVKKRILPNADTTLLNKFKDNNKH
jgi:CubicO group peptidase (beta-lactamase class C family)